MGEIPWLFAVKRKKTALEFTQSVFSSRVRSNLSLDTITLRYNITSFAIGFTFSIQSNFLHP